MATKRKKLTILEKVKIIKNIFNVVLFIYYKIYMWLWKSLFIIQFCVETVYFKTTSFKKSYNTVSIWVKKKFLM
jgi:hypothetical protein